METTLDVAGLPKEGIQYLKDLISIWKGQGEDSDGLQPITKLRDRALSGEVAACISPQVLSEFFVV